MWFIIKLTYMVIIYIIIHIIIKINWHALYAVHDGLVVGIVASQQSSGFKPAGQLRDLHAWSLHVLSGFSSRHCSFNCQ